MYPRRRKSDRTDVHVYLDQSELAFISQYCEQKQITKTSFLRSLILDFRDQHIRKAPSDAQV